MIFFFLPQADDDDEFAMTNEEKIQYLIGQGFPDHERIREVLNGTDWDLQEAWYILAEDLVAEQVISH